MFDVASKKKISLGCSSNLSTIAAWSTNQRLSKQQSIFVNNLTVGGASVSADQLATSRVAAE
jgi:hypothetical protein